MKLQDKAAVITGAGSGVGRATAFLFAREGAAVACVDIDPHYGNETAAEIRRGGGEATFIEADLGDTDAIARMAEACVLWRDRIHILFNNAGMFVRGGFEAVTLQDWHRQIAVNLTAPYLCSHMLLPSLKAAGTASIIHHGSIDGALGNPHLAAYSAAKGGLVPLTHVMAHALGPHGIRVNCIHSGAIRLSEQNIPVRLFGAVPRGDDMPDLQRRATPLGRSGKVEEVAAVALFLASGESAYVNGSILTVDGGRTGLTQGV